MYALTNKPGMHLNPFYCINVAVSVKPHKILSKIWAHAVAALLIMKHHLCFLNTYLLCPKYCCLLVTKLTFKHSC